MTAPAARGPPAATGALLLLVLFPVLLLLLFHNTGRPPRLVGAARGHRGRERVGEVRGAGARAAADIAADWGGVCAREGCDVLGAEGVEGVRGEDAGEAGGSGLLVDLLLGAHELVAEPGLLLEQLLLLRRGVQR